jgi:hypothetical protein
MAAINESKEPAGLITSIFPVILDGFWGCKDTHEVNRAQFQLFTYMNVQSSNSLMAS